VDTFTPALSGALLARAMLVAGRQLNEPVARHGPFVMNTPEQIRQAITDYQNGRL
jgi:quercetin 2,3-dioxygenase